MSKSIETQLLNFARDPCKADELQTSLDSLASMLNPDFLNRLLAEASRKGNSEGVKKLLASKADANATQEIHSHFIHTTETPLMLAEDGETAQTSPSPAKTKKLIDADDENF